MKYLCMILGKCRQLLGALPPDPHWGAAPGPCGGTSIFRTPHCHPWKNPAGVHVYSKHRCSPEGQLNVFFASDSKSLAFGSPSTVPRKHLVSAKIVKIEFNANVYLRGSPFHKECRKVPWSEKMTQENLVILCLLISYLVLFLVILLNSFQEEFLGFPFYGSLALGLALKLCGPWPSPWTWGPWPQKQSLMLQQFTELQ